MSTYELASKLAISSGFAGVEDIQGKKDGRDVFVVRFKELEYTGLPLFILCSSEKAEFASPEENVTLFREFK